MAREDENRAFPGALPAVLGGGSEWELRLRETMLSDDGDLADPSSPEPLIAATRATRGAHGRPITKTA